MFSAFFLKAYRPPRELTWISGFFLLVLFMAFGFSGYLLPWNELSFFATRVGTDIAGSMPLVGKALKTFILGGPGVTEATLGRFFWLHVAVLPAAALLVVGVHVLLIQTLGMSRPDRDEAGPGDLVLPAVHPQGRPGLAHRPGDHRRHLRLPALGDRDRRPTRSRRRRWASSPSGTSPSCSRRSSSSRRISCHRGRGPGHPGLHAGRACSGCSCRSSTGGRSGRKTSPVFTAAGALIVIYIVVLTALTYLAPNLGK